MGCGYWGKNLVRNFAELGALAGIADANPEAASAASAQYSVPVMTVAEMVSSDVIDAVVTQPNGTVHLNEFRKSGDL